MYIMYIGLAYTIQLHYHILRAHTCIRPIFNIAFSNIFIYKQKFRVTSYRCISSRMTVAGVALLAFFTIVKYPFFNFLDYIFLSIQFILLVIFYPMRNGICNTHINTHTRTYERKKTWIGYYYVYYATFRV